MYKLLLVALLVFSVVALTTVIPSNAQAYYYPGKAYPAYSSWGYAYPTYGYGYGYGCGYGYGTKSRGFGFGGLFGGFGFGGSAGRGWYGGYYY